MLECEGKSKIQRGECLAREADYLRSEARKPDTASAFTASAFSQKHNCSNYSCDVLATASYPQYITIYFILQMSLPSSAALFQPCIPTSGHR